MCDKGAGNENKSLGKSEARIERSIVRIHRARPTRTPFPARGGEGGGRAEGAIIEEPLISIQGSPRAESSRRLWARRDEGEGRRQPGCSSRRSLSTLAAPRGALN
jgi:hypothetical protein